jgi:hypothetical protein
LSIRNQPFYEPIDYDNIAFDHPNLSYEESVLFMVANYQYLITCMAFSIAKPFRKQICTNYPFLFCVIFLFIFNGFCVFLPADNRVAIRFDLQPFSTEDGTSYYSYRYWIGLGIVLNSLMTYGAEALIVRVITRKADANKKLKKQMAFHSQMRGFKTQVKDIEYLLTDRDEDISD